MAGMSIASPNVLTLLGELFHTLDMENPPWRQRLTAAIEADPRSMNRISLDAGFARNHVGQFINDEKGPKIDTLLKLCRTLNVSPTYILLGYHLDHLSEQILQLLLQAPVEEREALLALLRARLRP